MLENNAKGGKSMFSMVKERHRRTYEDALSQGKVDPQMQGLCGFVAKTKGFYTSSCCSGRIILLEKKGGRKIDTFFHRKWHRKITLDELAQGLEEKTVGEIWLKVDPFILHIGCGSLEDASKILAAMKKAGVKRGGIIVAGPGKFMVELQGTEKMDVPVKKGETVFADGRYLAHLTENANALLEKNYARLEKLGQEFRKALK